MRRCGDRLDARSPMACRTVWAGVIANGIYVGWLSIVGRLASLGLGSRQQQYGAQERRQSSKQDFSTAPPLAATKQVRRAAPSRSRWTPFAAPTGRHVAMFAIKHVSLLTRRNRESHGGPRRKTVCRFARRPIEHRAKRHTALLRGPPWFSLFLRVKNLLTCFWDQHPGPVIDVSRLAATNGCASRRAPALGATLAEAPRISVLSTSQRKFVAGHGDLDG